MSPKFYLVPSANIYEYHVFNKNSNEYSHLDPIVNIVSIGPDIEFEYNPNEKFSFTISLGEVSYGLASTYDNSFSDFQIHSILGFGIHFNFPR